MILAALLLAGTAQATPLDRFDTVAAWQASASDGVGAAVTSVPGANGKALRLDYDFGTVSGYAFARRALPIDFPANYAIRLKLRGSGGVNDLQIKFTDADGTNVWWYRVPNFRASAEWQDIRIRPRDIEFAWGPTPDKTLRRTAAMEIVVVRGRDGGAGTLEVDELTFEPLPEPRPLPAPVASDPRAIDGRRDTASALRPGRPLAIDFGGMKELGGVTLRWADGAGARAYAIEASDDGRSWRTLRRVTAGDGGDDPILLTDTETRRLRVALPAGARPAQLAELTVHPLEWGATPNAFVASLAKVAPRGSFPRGFSGEQPYWTLVAGEDGSPSGLIGEDGAVEVAKGGFSIEPFVFAEGRLHGWADVKATQALKDGDLPMPRVDWAGQGFTLDTRMFADAGSDRLMARWRLTNTAATARTLRLVLAVRPMQVNPPAQFLGQPGGVSAVSAIRWSGQRLAVTAPGAVDGDAPVTRTIVPATRPTAVGMRGFDDGGLRIVAAANGRTAVDDPAGMANATMVWQARLAPGQTIDVPMLLDASQATAPLDVAAFDAAEAATGTHWRRLLDRVTITVPAEKQAVADTVRTTLAHMLMSRDGPMLKPGTRSYDRAWIRDGAMMSDTLLRLGMPEPARAFADWYGPKLFANGKVPCCVDARGPDPVPENDSHGQYIHLVTQLYRYTGDRAALERDWPRLDAARRYMEGLRQSERTAANRTPDRRMLYGLMPPSISHEGYSEKAQYSLWDNFWALAGYKAAADAARVLGKAEAAEIAAQRDEFAGDLHAAIRAAVAHWKIDYIPGATSLGDFDATSTTMALDPAGEQARLDQRLLGRTFERQWQRVMARPTSTDWDDYTPYELRNVSAFVRLGWRTQANALLDFYMADRRPAAWNGWAEVVGRDPRKVRFIGDMPHAWVGSDFIRAALDLFAYERIDDGTIVLGAGLDAGWLSGEGSAIRGLRTTHGGVDLVARADADRLEVTIAGDAMPPGGFVLPWPFDGRPGRATVNGRRASFDSDGLRIAATGQPIRVIVERR